MRRPTRLPLVAPCLALFLALGACSGLFFYPQRELQLTPDRAGLVYRDIRFTASDGVPLHGWFLPADRKSVAGPPCTVVFLHGNAENVGGHLASVFWLPARGVNVFLFDYRGYGMSGGSPDLDGLHRDTEAALATAIGLPEVDADRIVVFGQSLGGAVAIAALARSAHRGRVRALIVEGAFSGYRTIAREKLAASWLTWPLQWPLGLAFNDDYKPLKAIGKLSPMPVLIVHGLADRLIPLHHARALYAAAGEPKDLWLIPKAAHIAAFGDEKNRMRLVGYLRERGCAINGG